MKKLLFLIDNLGSGGAQRQIINISALLQAHGYTVTILTYQSINFFQNQIDLNKLQHHSIKSGKMARIFAVNNYIKKANPDVVITFLETPNIIGCICKMLGGKWKLITSERSAKDLKYGLKGKIYGYLERFSDYKVCNSENAKNLWKKTYPFYAHKLRVIYNPVRVLALKSDYQIRKNEKTHIVVAASYQKLKNICSVVESVAILPETVRKKLQIDWYGRIEVTSGNTAEFEKAVNLIKKHSLENTILLHDETEDIYNIMNSADVVGLFSVVEGLPNTICEGMILGKPIIMSKVSDYNMLVDRNGITFDPHSIESMSNAFINIVNLSNSELIEWGTRSKELAQKLFDDSVIKGQWVDIIEG